MVFKIWFGVGKYFKNVVGIIEGVSYLGFYFFNRFLREFVMNLIESIYLIFYRFMLYKLVVGKY